MRQISLLTVACTLLSLLAGCADHSDPTLSDQNATKEGPHLERIDPRFDALIEPGTEIEILADGFRWSEGPVWVEDGGYLLFSDVPTNRIHKWSDAEGLSTWLEPSGYTGTEVRTAWIGSNGLAIDSGGDLIIAQHGDRRIVRLISSLDNPQPEFETIVDRWDGKRLNSPNDLVFDSYGNLYFTDPPYGLDGEFDDPAKEIPFSGVFRLNKNGEIDVIDDQNLYPNGIALSADERTLYVTNSGPDRKLLIAYDISDDGTVGNRRTLVDMTALEGGAPDGLKLDKSGNIWMTGPGGVRVFAADGSALGAILVGTCANLGWEDDGSSLYLTAGSYLMRVKTKASGL